MADVQVTIDARELERLLERFNRQVNGRISSTMAIVAENLVAAVSDRFESAGDGEWPELAESTLRSRRGGGSGAQILVDTGRLAGSIRGDSGADFAEATSDVAYAIYHVTGTSRMPRRDPFDVSDAVLNAQQDLIVDALLEAMR